jgi:hypothetical protein
MAAIPTPTAPMMNAGHAWMKLAASAVEYARDRAERNLLFWDTMRKRGNVYLEHAIEGKPPLLKFAFELLVDGHTLERPTNYALLHVLPAEGMPQTDPDARPIVIVDPRAGHGPGIAGFKPDSQVGVAMRAGHPVYFITFGPDPVPGQTLADIAWAEARFIETVRARHTNYPKKPAIIGNCQAGWAVAALAAVRPEIMGPILLNGAPMSYWAGSAEQNPMRYSGGTLGGSWMASMSGDLGGGVFDGQHLVNNFENLNPANTLWGKHYNLYANIDTEEDRFLDFERWWGGYFRMTTAEIESIVENLFVGNRLAAGTVELAKDRTQIDLRNISSPVVVFASFGDNITPPQQALDWIADVWGDEKAIVAAGRTIVYLLHHDIGHLGIFVGAGVARKEHTQLIDTLDQIDVLPPGLYEMVVEHRNPTSAQDALSHGDWSVRFESRRVADLRKLEADGSRDDEAVFSTIAQFSEWNATAYKTLVRPWLAPMSTRPLGELSMALSPKRVERSLLSDANPLMKPVREWAAMVRADRHPTSKDNPFVKAEAEVSKAIMSSLDAYRVARDGATARWVEMVYGPFGLGAILPPAPALEDQARERAKVFLDEMRVQAEPLIEVGGFPEGLVRMLFAAIAEKGVLNRRSVRIAQIAGRLADELARRGQLPGVTSPIDWKTVRENQAKVLALYPERAIDALPKLLADDAQRALATALVGKILLMDVDGSGDVRSQLADRAETLLGIDYDSAKSSIPAGALDDDDPHFPPVDLDDGDAQDGTDEPAPRPRARARRRVAA